MPALSVAEAKELAHYIKHSHARIFNTVPLGKWLTAISLACGFRDWNVMSAKAAKVPDSAHDSWDASSLGFAVVCAPDRPTSYHLVRPGNSILDMAEVAEKLAHSIVSAREHRFVGATATFSLLDPADSLEHGPEIYFPKRRKHSTALPPVKVTIADGDVTIWLWWLRQSYLLRAVGPSESGTFGYYAMDEQSMTSENECITTSFLRQLTGKTQPKKSCYYCTELPNERHLYRLMLVQEGNREGQPTQFVYDDHDSAFNKKEALNSDLGVSQRDAQTISAIFGQYDPYYEEDFFDDYSHNND